MAAEAPAIIDLGDDFAPRERDDAGGGRAGVGSAGGASPRRAPRRWTIAVLALALLPGGGSVAGSTGALADRVRIQAEVGDSYQLFDDALYVWGRRRPGGQGALTRYDLAGHVRWRQTAPGAGSETYVLETDHETIVDEIAADGVSRLIGLDRATGAWLWDEPAIFGAGHPDVRMVDPRGRLLVFEFGDLASRLRWVDSRSGQVIWQMDLPSDWNLDLQSALAPGQRLWMVGLGGEVATVTLDDRGLRVSHRLAGLAGGGSLDYRTVTAGRGLVLVTDVAGIFPQRQYATLHAYDGKTLVHLWDDAPGTDASPSFCGTRICETSSRGLSVADPATGRHEWSTQFRVVYPSGSNLVIGPYSPAGLGRQALVRSDDGARVADLSSWSLVPMGPSSFLLIQPMRGSLGIWLARMDASADRPTILGAIPGMSTRCRASARDIACRAIDGTIVLWHLT